MEYVYVCLFSNGHIKVGRSIDPKSRIATHVSRVACLGVSLVDSCVFQCEDRAAEAEQALIDFCVERASQRNQYEWFDGLDYEEVKKVAEQISIAGATDFAPTGWAEYLIRILRCGYTQARIASLIGCAQPSIANVLNGRTTSLSFRVGYGLLQIGRQNGLADPVDLFPIKPA